MQGGLKLLFLVVLPYGVTAAFKLAARLAWRRGLAAYEGAGG
jgi:hypothetical protein